MKILLYNPDNGGDAKLHAPPLDVSASGTDSAGPRSDLIDRQCEGEEKIGTIYSRY